MSDIGISEDGSTVAEGQSSYGGRLIWPRPFISQAQILGVTEDDSAIEVEQNLYVAKLMFREDSFDPVTRIRRGRFYQRINSLQPMTWKGIRGFVDGRGPLDERLFTFAPATWRSIAPDIRPMKARVVLGLQDAFSVWDVVMVERMAGRSELITLRARSTLGLLIDAHELCIPPDSRADVQAAIDAAVNASHRLVADATVDAARQAAVAALRAWLEPDLGPSILEQDLGAILKSLETKSAERKPQVVINIGLTLARLHSRTKINERARLGIRGNEDADGECAIAMLGLLLRELREPPRISKKSS